MVQQLVIFLLLCSLMLPVIQGAEQGLSITLVNDPTSLRCDDIIEWRFPVHTQAKRYDVQNTAFMIINDSNGNTYTRRAFLSADYIQSANSEDSGLQQSGARYYAIRHSSRTSGAHTWKAFLANNTLAAQGSFTVKNNNTRGGILQRSTTNPRLLAFTNGDIFIATGLNIAWATPPYRLEKHLAYIRSFAKNGGNHIRLWMCSWSAGIESNTPDQYRLDHAYLLDRILELCRQKNVYVTLVLDNHHDLVHGKSFPYGKTVTERIKNFLSTPLSEQYKRRLRYIVARYGSDSHIMNWELFNELDEVLFDNAPPASMGNLRTLCARWVTASATFMKSIDQDQHLISSSLSWSDWDDVMAAQGLDLVQVHTYIPPFKNLDPLQKDGILPLQARIPQLTRLARPYSFSELGYQGSNEHNDGHLADPHGLLLRQQLWASFLLGSYGSGMTWWWDTYIDKNNLWKLYQPFTKSCAYIDWQDPQLKPLQANQGSSLRAIGWQSSTQALIWPQLRDNSWHRLSVQKQAARTFQQQHLVLKPMKADTQFHIRWISQVDGRIILQQELSSDSDGRLVIACPSGKREAVVIVTP